MLAAERGLTLIPPYDHPHVIAGQGTAAKELFEEVGDLDALFVSLGEGGLLSGTALSAQALSPGCKLYGVEPEAGNDGQRSLRQGSIVRIDTPKTIADGAQTQRLGTQTFAIIRRDVDDILTVTDAELVESMRTFASVMKIVVKPTGCLGFAAVRELAPRLRGHVVEHGVRIEYGRRAFPGRRVRPDGRGGCVRSTPLISSVPATGRGRTPRSGCRRRARLAGGAGSGHCA
ncbi:threonine dehydratase [Streptosporangium album]|uniref:Threonine dehydratase n=1 Tax=Streptosporangium album TaxID=47479 RepID=A0A7W7W803_9ACTN|nr:threonine dehydratase [Streptosporangium album]